MSGPQISNPESDATRQALEGNGSPSDGYNRKRRKVTRTRSGCLTCRKRRKACDMVKPDCGACTRLKRECCWPEISSNKQHKGIDRSHDIPRSLLSAPQTSHPHSEMQETTWDASVADLNGIFGSTLAVPHGLGPTPSLPPPPLAPISAHAEPFQYQPIGAKIQDAEPFRDNSRSDLFLQDIDLDEVMLQSWAANCLNGPGSQDPFQSLSELLGISPASSSVRDLVASRSASPSSRQHGPLLQHYQRSLSKLVSCTTDGSPSSFEAFTQLAAAQSSSRVGKGLHLGILAWAGRHMTNEGEVKYEALSERLGEEASRIIAEQAAQVEQGLIAVEETTRLTLLGGLLMVVQWKICRGDVWGYEGLIQHLRSLADALFTPTSPGVAPDSMPFSFFENLLYHDILSVRAYTKGPIIPLNTLLSYSGTAVDSLNTLTGACLPLFIKMHRIAHLTRMTRSRSSWNDEALIDTVAAAETLEEELKDEKKRMDGMIRARPDLASHRYLHEAFRIACLLSLSTFVLKTPPSSLRVRLLVRQALSLLQQMHDQNLPGYCSSHWVLFITALCSTTGGAPDGDLDDCERIEQLYDDHEDDWAFNNIPRSRRIAQEVRARNDEGRKYVDWIDVVEEYEWELWLV